MDSGRGAWGWWVREVAMNCWIVERRYRARAKGKGGSTMLDICCNISGSFRKRKVHPGPGNFSLISGRPLCLQYISIHTLEELYFRYFGGRICTVDFILIFFFVSFLRSIYIVRLAFLNTLHANPPKPPTKKQIPTVK